MPAPTEYPISNRYKITTQDHGRFLKIGDASNSDVSTWEVQFVPDASWDGEFAVMGRLAHTSIEADGGPFLAVPFRKVVLNGASGLYTMVASEENVIRSGSILQIPATGLVIAMLASVSAGYGYLYSKPLVGPSVP